MNNTSGIVRYPGPAHLPLSKAVRAGGFIFFSGVMPADAQGQPFSGSITEETEAVLQQIARNLQSVGASLQDVVRTTVWLADLGDFVDFNKVYEKHFAGTLPTRSTVQAKLNRGALVEIEVQAWVGEQKSA